MTHVNAVELWFMRLMYIITLLFQTPENPLGRQDLNESTVDLGINLNSRDGENDSDSMNDQIKDGEPETLDSVKA